MQVLYTAAHAVEHSESFPLGGGAAITRRLTAEWARTRRFDVRVLGPAILGRDAPAGSDIVRFTESAYASFCRAFERATTEEILRHDPAHTVVLANDIAEGPDFARLHRAGFRLATIFHVDVVAYICSMYLGNRVKPETTVRWLEFLRRIPLPAILRLIWDKQRDCVHSSQHLIVPSTAMQKTLERCYPQHAPGKVRILPWGAEPATPPSAMATDALRTEFRISPGTMVLLTLSRISPEKGQHILLESLLEWERSTTPPRQPVVLLLCGGAAYMQGNRYHNRLQALAARLKQIRVHFPGHVTGPRKAACLALADLYVFPSIHESYGLTLMEALSAGLPAVCLPSHGASEVMRPDFGAIVGPEGLWQTIRLWLEDESGRGRAAEAAKLHAARNPFTEAAEKLADVLV